MENSIRFSLFFLTDVTVVTMKLNPCPECGSTNVKYMACTSCIRCKSCGKRNVGISEYINRGYTQKQAAYHSWNDMCDKELRLRSEQNGTKEEDPRSRTDNQIDPFG